MREAGPYRCHPSARSPRDVPPGGAAAASRRLPLRAPWRPSTATSTTARRRASCCTACLTNCCRSPAARRTPTRWTRCLPARTTSCGTRRRCSATWPRACSARKPATARASAAWIPRTRRTAPSAWPRGTHAPRAVRRRAGFPVVLFAWVGSAAGALRGPASGCSASHAVPLLFSQRSARLSAWAPRSSRCCETLWRHFLLRFPTNCANSAWQVHRIALRGGRGCVRTGGRTGTQKRREAATVRCSLALARVVVASISS